MQDIVQFIVALAGPDSSAESVLTHRLGRIDCLLDRLDEPADGLSHDIMRLFQTARVAFADALREHEGPEASSLAGPQ